MSIRGGVSVRMKYDAQRSGRCNEEQQKEWHAGSDWFASEKKQLKITLKEKKMNIKG